MDIYSPGTAGMALIVVEDGIVQAVYKDAAGAVLDHLLDFHRGDASNENRVVLDASFANASDAFMKADEGNYVKVFGPNALN